MGLRGAGTNERGETLHARTYLKVHQSEILLYFKSNACDDVQRIDDIAERLAHLPSVGISHHCVQIHLDRQGNQRGVNSPGCWVAWPVWGFWRVPPL